MLKCTLFDAVGAVFGPVPCAPLPGRGVLSSAFNYRDDAADGREIMNSMRLQVLARPRATAALEIEFNFA
jgi:hypothetical protein